VKNMPGPLFWLYLPQHLLLNLAALCFSQRGQGRVAKLDALLAGWRARTPPSGRGCRAVRAPSGGR
jgi:hypothetical protein